MCRTFGSVRMLKRNKLSFPRVTNVSKKIPADEPELHNSFLEEMLVPICKLLFIILKSALLCIRGSRSHIPERIIDDDFSIAHDKARI